MNNLLFVITKSEVGGAQKFVKEQVDITSEHFNVSLCTNKTGWLTEALSEKISTHLHDEGIERMSSLRFLLNLYFFIKKNKISLVITNSANAGFYGRIAAFLAGVPSCYFSHGWSSVYNGGRLSTILNYIERILAKLSVRVICISDNDYRIAVKEIRIPKKKLCIVKNAIFPVNYNLTAITSNIKEGFKIIALVRFAKPKRLDLMIDALRQLPNITLDIAGSGSDFNYWQHYINSKNISNVNLLGEVQAFDKFANYKAFILISDSEGLPISAIEAMSAGLPLILSNVGGCTELIYNNGVLVENNISSIINGINEVVNKSEYFSNNSVTVFNQNFNLYNIGYKYIDMYKKMISN
jgi:glycosyltransferase involved in cell wall biosynthesis